MSTHAVGSRIGLQGYSFVQAAVEVLLYSLNRDVVTRTAAVLESLQHKVTQVNNPVSLSPAGKHADICRDIHRFGRQAN